MIKDICSSIVQNKNLLMFVSVSFYVLALFGVLSNHLILVSALFSIFLGILIYKNLFPLKYIGIWCLIFYLGVFNTIGRLKDNDELLNLAPINSEITGEIVSIPQGFSEGKPKFFFNLKKIKFGHEEKEFENEKILVTINSFDKNIYTSKDLKIYNTYKLKGRLSLPFKAGNPSQFDYGNYLRNHNAHAVFYAKECSQIDKNLTKFHEILQKINDYRENIIKVHSKYMQSPNLEILGGIVFGDDAISPSKEIKQSFINSGLLHILAASGMNVAFIYGFFFSILAFFRVNYKVNVSLGILTVLIYCLMTGMGASVIRAAGMLIFVLIGKLIDRDAHSISLLSFVALLMLLYNPLFINDVGFQLSFIVTLGILLMSPLVIKFNNKFYDFIIGSISIPIIAQLWVIPIQIFYFNNISVYSVFANIMSVPFLMVISFGGFISSLLSIVNPLSDFICKWFDFILNPLISILVNISDFWGKLPHSTLQTTHPSIIQIFLYYGILLCLVGLCNKDFREKYFKKIGYTTLVCVSILLISIIPIKNTNLEILAFDVGNADSFFIKTPKNQYIFIDTGKSAYNGGKSQAEIIILKYLKDKGIKNIESIILTHFDNDHAGGAVDLLKQLKVKNIYVNSIDDKSNSAQKIYKTAQKVGTKVILGGNSQVVSEEYGLKIKNYLYNSTSSENDKSIQTLLKYNDFTMLFTGDAGINAIENTLKYFPKNITILKVPHHGAIGGINSGIAKYLNPKYSIVSVGENKFGHPSTYTLAMLNNSKILRTDVNNAILIKVKKNDFKIFTYDIKNSKWQELN